ncbi:protein kinase domain-containing protein, partial [Kitasatospora nipponensis]|uniref:class III lanthionine synthetase LanKC N-terminal domain-containing protein n=1 Tax=Kitasatospora nipponensis TaxID=258049 RepID=UPI0031D2672F
MRSAAPAGAQSDPGTVAALRERLAALALGAPGAPRRVFCDKDWLYLHNPRMPVRAHGWKLHISARPEQLPELVDLVVPVLLRHTCDVKFAAGVAVLRELNSGVRDPGAVGKAATVYPVEGEEVALATELASALVGWTGPRVVSDRQLRPDAPVYYRYGLFQVAEGESTLLMTGPDGTSFPARAANRYRQPPWASDPFAVQSSPPRTTTRVGDGRYRITAGITRSPNGHVYRAVEVATGRELVVKQARAFVAEDDAGIDAIGRLRHERRVLAALTGVTGVPQLVDYFRHGTEEYLVSSGCGPRDLRRDVLAFGPYAASVPATGPTTGADGEGGDRGGDDRGDGHRGDGDRDGDGPDGGPGRTWWVLAGALVRVLDAVHARGVVMCDLKPANVVLDPSGACSLVDFGVSALDGERPEGATPGYGLPGRAQAQPADDYYALGMTLHYALTGLDPVVVDPDPATNRDRTLACLAGVLPDRRHPAHAVVAGLLSFDPARRTATAAQLRAGRRPVGDGHPPPLRAALPLVSAGELGAIVDHTVTSCVRMAHALVAADPRGGEPRTLLSLYEGSAGLGLELLQHADLPDARAAAAELAHWTAAHPALEHLTPALYEGRTGVELFLADADRLLGADGPTDRSAGPGTDPAGAGWALR